MQLHIVPWAKYENGKATGPSGFSVHRSAQDAAEYVLETTKHNSFFGKSVAYSGPDISQTGGFEIITIDILPTNDIARSLNSLNNGEKGMRVFKSQSGYREMMDKIIKYKHDQKRPPTKSSMAPKP